MDVLRGTLCSRVDSRVEVLKGTFNGRHCLFLSEQERDSRVSRAHAWGWRDPKFEDGESRHVAWISFMGIG